MSDERIPNGTRVQYHGSHTDLHGEYIVRNYYPYAGEDVYDIWPASLPYKWGFRDQAIYAVRRPSITVIEDA